jgi:hypothetical protein
VINTISPPTVSVPARLRPLGLAAILILTVPSPLPLTGLVIKIHGSSDSAIHVQ